MRLFSKWFGSDRPSSATSGEPEESPVPDSHGGFKLPDNQIKPAAELKEIADKANKLDKPTQHDFRNINDWLENRAKYGIYKASFFSCDMHVRLGVIVKYLYDAGYAIDLHGEQINDLDEESYITVDFS